MQGVEMTRKLLTRRRVLSGAAALSAATILPRSSLADWRPTETIRIIVPAAAGGSTDVMGRLLGAISSRSGGNRQWWKTARAAAAPSARRK
jgi:tripartite-type tricarboxylate transporter receptor subunit TctC